MDGNPIDDLIKTNQKLSGITFTPEEIEEMKSSYQGNPELAFQDMVNTVQKARNIKFSYKERLDMKAQYGVPMAWVDIMALSENPELKTGLKNKAGESSAAGLWQVTSVHEPNIRKMFGVSHSDFIKDADKQERYVKEKLEPEYDKNLSEFRDTVEEGIKEGRFKDYEKYMVNGRFTDDQIKSMNHLLGSSGARYFFNNGTFTGTEPDRKARDAKRTLQQMVGLRKQYGVPTSLQDQYNFGDVVKQAAEEVTAATTPTLGGGQASVQKGPKIAGQSTDIDWGAGTVTTKFDKKQIKAEAKKKTTTTTPQGQPQFGVGRSVVDLQVTDKGESIQNADEVFKSGAPNERKIKENAWLENTAKAKEITSDFSQYKDKKVDPTNLNDEELKLRDEIQQKLRAEKEVLNSSQYMLRDKYGANVEKDIQDLLSNQSAVIDDISNLEKTIKDKYQGKTPSNADIAPLTKKRAELGDNIRDLVVQQNALNAKAEELNNKLKEFGERPGITEEEYNRYYNEINREFANISNQFDALGADIGRLNQDYEQVRLQEQSLIDKYNEEASNINSQYASDSDVQKLKTKLGEYNKNLGRIQKYQEDPFFNSYLDSLYNITDLGKSYKNLFPDVLEGEERSKELAKLARDIVKKEKTEYWSPQNIFIDLYNGVKSLYTDAPATGVFSTLLNSLKTASYNIAGDFIGAAASLSDLAGAEDVARKLRVGDLYGANVTKMNIEQDVTRGAVRSDIQGNTVEKYYTVKETDDELFSTGLQPGDRVILEEGIPVSYRGADGFKKDLNLIPGTNPDKVVENFVKGKPTKDDYSVIRTVTSSLPSIIDMASLIGFNYAAMPRISRLFAKAGTRSAAGLAANFGMQTFQQYGDLYSSYLQKGLSPGDAAKYALGQSAGVALIELFNPLEMKVASLGGDAAVNSFRKIIDTSVDLFARGKIGTKDLLANIGIGAATALKEAGIEGGTELIQGEFENIVENYATNGNKSTSMNDSFNTLATTLAVVFLPSISMGGAAYRNAKSDVITSSIFKAAQNKEQFLKDLDKAVENGKLEISEAAGIKNYVEYIKDELDEYGTITDNQGAALTGLIGTRYYYENKKKNSTNETAKKEIDKKIEEINKTIQDVVSGAKKPEVDPFVAEFVGEKGKDKETPTKEDINTKKAYDFDDTLFDNKTGKLTKLGEDVKKRIEAGEDIVIVTARGENQTQQIQDVLGVGVDKIEATGDEAKKPEALQKRGISSQEYYDENQEKLAAIQGKAAPSQAAGAMTKEQQAELDKVSKRAERIQRTLQEDAALQEEGDEPMLSPEQKTKLETELQTLNQRKDAIQKQSTAEVPIQPGAEGGPGVGGQVQAKPEGPAGKGKGKGKAESKVQEQINDKEFKDFVDKNVVTPARIESISNKVINNETLSPREQQIFTSRTTDVNKKIEEIAAAQKQAPQAKKKAEPTPTPTTTGKVAPKAAEAPQKANTVQGFELTKKDGTKAAPAEYRKNEKGNWGKVNAKGGVTPVSSPAQVAELENALSSQTKAAAETKKAAPAKTPDALKDVESTKKALKGKTKGLLTEPTTEQLAKETKDKNVVTFNFDKESDVPNAFKDKISSRGEVNGKKVIRVTLPKSMADYLLAKDDPQAIAEAYHKAKKDGSNPALVEAVEGLLGVAPSQPAAAQTSKAQRIIDEQKKATQLSKEISKKIKDIMSLSKSMFNRFGVKTRVVDKKTLQKEIRAKFKDLAFSRTGAPVISATKPEGKISEKDFKDLKNLADELGFTLSATRNKTYAVYLDNLTGTIYYNSEADIKDPVKNLQDLYDANSVADLKNKLDELLPEEIQLMDLKDNRSNFYIAIPDLDIIQEYTELVNFEELSRILLKDSKNLDRDLEIIRKYENSLDWWFLSENPSLNPTLEMLREFKDKWDWDGLSANQSLNLTPEIIREFKDKWRWRSLSKNKGLNPTVELLREFKDNFDWRSLSQNSSLNPTPEMLREFKDNFDWDGLSQIRSLNPTLEMLREFKYNFDFDILSANQSLNPTPEMLREFKNKWNWDNLSSNPSLNPTLEMLREFKNKWNWDNLSSNPSLNPTLEILKEFKDKWYLYYLSSNSSLNPTPEMLRVFERWEWEWSFLSSNRSLNPTLEMLREFENKWNWWSISGHRNFNITKEIANEFKNYIDWTEASRQNKLKPWHLDYVGINVKSANKAKFTKLSSVGLPTESVRHYFPLFTGKNSKQIINYWMDTWKSGLTTVESATTNPDLINSDVINDYKGGGFVVFSNDSNFLFYSPEDNYSIPKKTLKTKGPKNLKYATRSTAIIDSSVIRERILGMDLNGSGRDEWIIELSPANIDYIQFNLKGESVDINGLTSNGKNIWKELGGEVSNSVTDKVKEYLENYTSDKETFSFAIEDLASDLNPFDYFYSQFKKSTDYLLDLVKNDKIDNFSGDLKTPDFLQNLNDEFGVEIRLTSPDGKKTKTIPRKTINTFLSKSGGEVWGFYDNNLKEAVLRSDAPMEATVHEAFTHPFLEAAKVQNPKLYNSLLKQAAAKKEIKESVDKDYKDKTRAERNDEYIARAIDKYVKGELDAIKDKGLIKAILDFFKNISDNLKSFLDLPTSVKDISPDTTLKELAQYSLYGKGTIDLTTQPTPIAAETQVEVETKTAEQLSEDIQASIEAETAKEQEAMAKAFEGNKKQTAANDLIKNPKSAQTLPQDLLEELYNLAAEAKYTPALKKKCD